MSEESSGSNSLSSSLAVDGTCHWHTANTERPIIDCFLKLAGRLLHQQQCCGYAGQDCRGGHQEYRDRVQNPITHLDLLRVDLLPEGRGGIKDTAHTAELFLLGRGNRKGALRPCGRFFAA
jgi:hypothetical protein